MLSSLWPMDGEISQKWTTYRSYSTVVSPKITSLQLRHTTLPSNDVIIARKNTVLVLKLCPHRVNTLFGSGLRRWHWKCTGLCKLLRPNGKFFAQYCRVDWRSVVMVQVWWITLYEKQWNNSSSCIAYIHAHSSIAQESVRTFWRLRHNGNVQIVYTR